MFEQEDELEKIKKNLARAAKSPRAFEVISISDGFSYKMFDDGGSYRDNEGILPNGRRMNSMNAMAKKLKDGSFAFYAGKRIVSEDGSKVSYEPSQIEALFPGDPLASWQQLGKAEMEQMEKNISLRAESSKKVEKEGARELIDVLNAVAAKAKQESPKIEHRKSKQEQPKAEGPKDVP